MRYKFVGTLADADRFAYPKPQLGIEYTVEEYKFIMDMNCFCLAKYFEKV